MKTIASKIIGALDQNEKFQDWWKSAPVTIKLIDQDLPIVFMDFDPEKDASFIADADAALENFLKLESTYKFQIAQPIFENFVNYCSFISADDIPEKMKGSTPLNIWSFVYPTQVFVSRRPHNDKDIYIVLACECEWEKEHGLQIVFRQGKKLTRVSDQDGHLTEADAYDKPDSEDKLLSAF